MDTEIANAGSTSFKNEDIISIHAPAKGATAFSFLLGDIEIIFQSTLPRRERRN